MTDVFYNVTQFGFETAMSSCETTIKLINFFKESVSAATVLGISDLKLRVWIGLDETSPHVKHCTFHETCSPFFFIASQLK